MKTLGAEDGLGWDCGWDSGGERMTCELLSLISYIYLLIYVRMTYTFAGVSCLVEALLVVKFSHSG